jgi:hypothetical protein
MAIYGEEAFKKAIAETFSSIELCFTHGYVWPAQVLILSCIDAFSSIEFPDTRDAKERFVLWVSKRILPHDEVLCEAVDLYASRSAILHRFGTSSRLSESGQAQTIAFCHGSAPFSGLIELRDMLHSKSGRKIPIVRLEALFEALRGGINTFLIETVSNSELKQKMDRYYEGEQPFRFPI